MACWLVAGGKMPYDNPQQEQNQMHEMCISQLGHMHVSAIDTNASGCASATSKTTTAKKTTKV